MKGWREICRMAAIIAATLFVIFPASAGYRETRRLEVSPSDQPIDQFAEEWRRARKLMRACGYAQDVTDRVSFAEGLLLSIKADDARAHGQQAADNIESYALGHQDRFEIADAVCTRMKEQLMPVLDAVHQFTECRDRERRAEKSQSCNISILRAPRFP
jgi:hypothetical protein